MNEYLCLSCGSQKPDHKCNPERASGSQQRKVEDQQLRHLLHDLVDRICLYATEPSNWPLTQQEQIAFVRETICKARRIKNLEAYLADTMKLTAEELAMQS